MKNFEFLLCFLLFVLPCAFTNTLTTEEKMERMAKPAGITKQDLQECLDKANTDFETMLDLSDTVFSDDTPQGPANITKVGCFTACICKKNGLLVNSKIQLDKVIELVSRSVRKEEILPAVHATANKCSQEASTKTDECDIAYSFSRCFVQEMSRRN